MDHHEKLHQLTIGGVPYQTRLTGKFLARRPYAKPDPRRVTCVIPGVIREICVGPGADVAEGEKLLVFEAMKMKNEVVAHAGARIRSVCVKEGDLVTKGQLLVEFE